MPTEIEIVLNGRPVKVAAVTLAELVEQEQLGAVKVATALNGNFVPAVHRDTTKLTPGDRVEIVSPRQGG